MGHQVGHKTFTSLKDAMLYAKHRGLKVKKCKPKKGKQNK